MKNILKLIFVTWAIVLIFAAAAFSETVIIRSVRVGQNLRVVMIFVDSEGLHHQYYTEAGNGETYKLLGEEIFRKGEKVFDSFREND